MLGILVCWHSFFEFFELHLRNIDKFVKVPHIIYVLDNSAESKIRPSSVAYRYLRNTNIHLDPSSRHQQTINMGLAEAWKECDSFLFLDNDMVFLKEFTKEPEEDLAYVPTYRGTWDYCWLNLLYMKKKEDGPFEFKFWSCPKTGENTDSGGNSGLLLLNESLTKIKINPIFEKSIQETLLPDYQENLRKLCDEYKIPYEVEMYDFLGIPIFHFVKMSNYMKYPDTYLKQKKHLVMLAIEKNRLY